MSTPRPDDDEDAPPEAMVRHFDADMPGQGELVQLSASWSGPMPTPRDLDAYERILPGAADRILRMAELAVNGHLTVDKTYADGEVTTAKRGQLIAASITVIALLASIYFFVQGNNIAGVVLVSMPIVLIARAFLQRDSSGGGPDSPTVN